ncbi:acyl transferase/acyl hydrolase/lysophospholipase [Flagelloscypha sp. PMI_526]|nr:acyl transferase/acyl hydrolase/lysophospholipase [Flagelloscypha sp. PMI_526]
MAQRRGIRILTFDGENTTCSGVSSALETLQEIMHRVSWSESEEEDDKSTSSSNGSISLARPCDYFDLIVGSGDGAWIAAMLGRLGLSVSQAIDEYQRIHPSIHHSQPPLSIEEKGIQLELKLKDLVQAHSEDPKALLQASRSKLKCQVALLAMTPSNMAFPCVFRSYRAREHPLKNCAIWEAICAATAVTGVLPPYKIGGKTYIAASEARHCNPIETALQEAKVAFPHAEPSCVISLGAGHPGHVSLQGSDVTSVAAATLELVRDAEQASHNVQPRLNLQEQPQVYFRFNVEQGMQHYTQSSGPGYGDAHAHTTSYCKRQKVNLEINQVVDLLRDYQECLPSSVPSTALPEAKSIIHLHHSSEEPIQTYIDELYNLKRGLPLWDPQRLYISVLRPNSN